MRSHVHVSVDRRPSSRCHAHERAFVRLRAAVSVDRRPSSRCHTGFRRELHRVSSVSVDRRPSSRCHPINGFGSKGKCCMSRSTGDRAAVVTEETSARTTSSPRLGRQATEQPLSPVPRHRMAWQCSCLGRQATEQPLSRGSRRLLGRGPLQVSVDRRPSSRCHTRSDQRRPSTSSCLGRQATEQPLSPRRGAAVEAVLDSSRSTGDRAAVVTCRWTCKPSLPTSLGRQATEQPLSPELPD